jgi:ATP-dependent Lon protease
MKTIKESGINHEGMSHPGVVHLVTKGDSTGQLGLYRFETQMMAGHGKHTIS